MNLASHAKADAGFLAIDALVGLLVIALGLIAVLQAQSQVARMLTSAAEGRRTLAEAQYRLEAEWPKLGEAGSLNGTSDDRSMTWLVTARTLGPIAGSPLAICGVEATAQMRRSRDRVSLRTEQLCRAASSDE